MAKLFERDYKGNNVLTNIFNESVDFTKFFFGKSAANFVAMAKGQKSDYLGLSGDNKNERRLGLVTAPLSVPAHLLTYICALPLAAIVSGTAVHEIEPDKDPCKKVRPVDLKNIM